MKTAFIRMLALVSLATSLSGLAAAGETKHNDTANHSAARQQTGCAGADQEKKKLKEKKDQDHRTLEQEFDRVLMGIYG
jgi:hypothetical protein